jgi:hypothetical protein
MLVKGQNHITRMPFETSFDLVERYCSEFLEIEYPYESAEVEFYESFWGDTTFGKKIIIAFNNPQDYGIMLYVMNPVKEDIYSVHLLQSDMSCGMGWNNTIDSIYYESNVNGSDNLHNSHFSLNLIIQGEEKAAEEYEVENDEGEIEIKYLVGCCVDCFCDYSFDQIIENGDFKDQFRTDEYGDYLYTNTLEEQEIVDTEEK